MRTLVGWVVIVAAVLLIVALVSWARGPEHHRGDEVGALVHREGVVLHG